MNRGSVASNDCEALPRMGFNEAPIHESGKYRLPAKDDPEEDRFNEAPIHESGKFPSSEFRLLRTRRFNEAPIHESGKYARSIRVDTVPDARLQ